MKLKKYMNDQEKAETFKYKSAKDYPHKIIKLYKYVSDIAFFDFLKYGDLKITFNDDCNDPYELTRRGIYPDKSSRNVIGFISLSSNNNVPSLWGNYASQYCGACLEFSIPYFVNNHDGTPESEMGNFTDLLKLLGVEEYIIRRYYDPKEPDSLCTISYKSDTIMKCTYCDFQRPCENDDYREILLNAGVPREFWEHAKSRIYEYKKLASKHISWEHEKEYRIYSLADYATRSVYQGKIMYFSNILSPYLSKIILGPKINIYVSDVSRIINPAFYTKCSFSIAKAKFSPTSYLLDIPD